MHLQYHSPLLQAVAFKANGLNSPPSNEGSFTTLTVARCVQFILVAFGSLGSVRMPTWTLIHTRSPVLIPR